MLEDYFATFIEYNFPTFTKRNVLFTKNAAAALIATTFANMATQTVPNKRIRKCEFKGCRKTENYCIIKSHGCPEHQDVMENKGTEKRKANYVKYKSLKRMKFYFNVSSFSKTNEFVKYD